MTKTFTIELNEEQIDIIKGCLNFVTTALEHMDAEDQARYEDADLMVEMIEAMKAQSEQPEYDPNTVHGFCL